MYFSGFTTVAIAVLAATTQVTALGVNCRGSGLCSSCRAHALSEINTQIQALNDNNQYPNGQHIACSGSCCAFLQNISGTKSGRDVKGYIQQLLAHGCTKCGSQPTEPGNNVNTGELTVNYVS